MLRFFKSFQSDDSGAVTVDWVVLTAAVVTLAAVAFTSIESATGGVGSGVGTYLSSKTLD